MVEAILAFLFPHVARGRHQRVFACCRQELWSGVRFVARFGVNSTPHTSHFLVQ